LERIPLENRQAGNATRDRQRESRASVVLMKEQARSLKSQTPPSTGEDQMSNALTPQNLTTSAVPNIDLDQIQGDVLIGLQKFAEHFLFFQIKDVAGFKTLLRKKIAHRVTTTRTVQEREFHLRDHKNQGKTNLLPNIGVNLSFTASGIGKLIPGTNDGQTLGDASFAAGAKKQARSLGDPVDGSGNPNTWVSEFLNAAIDGVFIVTGGTDADVNDEAKKLLDILGTTVVATFQENGDVRPGLQKGHEHFGWLDGVSQPGISGLTSPFPGQRLLDPGLFAFGYGPTANPPLPWMRNGSFMVFRRLKQLVPEFDQFQLTQGQALGMDPVLLGARLVGRWKSGAPLELTPSQDDSTMGADPQRNNNFDFSDDQGERRCPFGAHIRKTNPRADFGLPNNAGVDPQTADVDPRRIMRAGIPFGPEVGVAEAANGKTTTDRGLMFVCYQTSIPNQFEFVQIKWANNPGFIVAKKHPDGSAVTVGFDPIIGQNAAATRARTTDEPVPNYPTGNVRSTLSEPGDFIVPTAAGYFFVPSIEALTNELST
jgi:Dyp-type peroxidase family